MKKLDMENAIEQYNSIMNMIGYEHNTIGTWLSENTDDWNLRDMVAEADYTLSTYYESGHANEEMRHSSEPDERKYWHKETSLLRKFIKHYVPYIEGMVAMHGHCSQYD